MAKIYSFFKELSSFFASFKNRKDTLNTLFLIILIITLPLGIDLVRQQQILRSRAAVAALEIVKDDCVEERNGKKVLTCGSVPLKIVSPIGGLKPDDFEEDEEDKDQGDGQRSEAPVDTPKPEETFAPLPQECNSNLKLPNGKPIVNIRDFNNNIQSALDCFKNVSLGGGAVYIPAGAYDVQDKIRVYSNVTVFGDGMNKTFIKQTKASDPLMANDSNKGQENITIMDLSLVGSGQSGGDRCCSGIEFANLTGGFINNVKVENFSYSGIFFSYKVKEDKARSVSKVRISNCYIQKNKGPGIDINMGDNNVVEKCTLLDNGTKQGAGVSIEMGAEGSASENFIVGNNITQPGPAITMISQVAGAKVANNRVCYNKEDTKPGIIDDGGEANLYIGNLVESGCVENDGKVNFSDKSRGYLEKPSPSTDSRCNIPSGYELPLRPTGAGIAAADNQAGDSQVQASCQTPDNLFGNCGFENPIKQVSEFQCTGIVGNWVSTGQYKPGRMSDNVAVITTDAKSGDKALAIGILDKKVCSDPKKYNGDHTRGNYSLFSEAFQVINFKGKSNIKINFWAKMKAEGGTDKASAPFYVYITSLKDPYPDKWLLQVYANGNNSCGGGKLASKYSCMEQGCSLSANEWKNITVSLSSGDLAKLGPDKGYISFGVMNNYPTQVLIDDVKVTALSSVMGESTDSTQTQTQTTPTPSPTATPKPSKKPVIYTKTFKIAESERGLVGAEEFEYSEEPEFFTYDLENTDPGLKQIWVEFKNSAGRKYKAHVNIILVEEDPEIKQLSCRFDLTAQNVVFDIKGERFGSVEGASLEADEGTFQVLSWSETAVSAVLEGLDLKNSRERDGFKVKLKRSDGQESEPVPCDIGVSQLSLGTEIFCREKGSLEEDNVSLIFIDELGNKVSETVKINKDGVIKGIKTKLQTEEDYTVSIKTPTSLRRNALFTAGEGTQVIKVAGDEALTLPIGDISPPGGDGVINSQDKSELNRQWDKPGNNLSGDFNKDGVVNTFDWACMGHNFGEVDDSLAPKVIEKEEQ
ncbi:right-handed parallel beta-helix repeat-containing protein [Candidatus Daviesbacteria bacterium]|nr:right-handed parallel beta-helix repeat-containing protein [Candidatus Daviesbacteria bacterium]